VLLEKGKDNQMCGKRERQSNVCNNIRHMLITKNEPIHEWAKHIVPKTQEEACTMLRFLLSMCLMNDGVILPFLLHPS
jgi:hypothetical protein